MLRSVLKIARNIPDQWSMRIVAGFLAMGLLASCATTRVSTLSDFTDQASQETANMPLVSGTKATVERLAGCQNQRAPAREKCLDEALEIGMAEINLQYTYADERFVLNTYKAKKADWYMLALNASLRDDQLGLSEEERKRLLQKILSGDPKKAAAKTQLFMTAYEFIATSSHIQNRARALYSEYTAAEEQARAQRQQAGMALLGISNSMETSRRLDNLERANCQQQNALRGGINMPCN